MPLPLEDCRKMLAPANSLLRAGIGLKLSQIKIATRVISARPDQPGDRDHDVLCHRCSAVRRAGIFLIAACFVGTVALYRWIAIHYGQFWAFGAIGALLVTIAVNLSPVWPRARLRQPLRRTFPSLTSRLRVAIKSNPLQTRPDRSRARYRRLSPAGAFGAIFPPKLASRRSASGANNRNIQAGLIVMATLLGWAATRRRSHARSRRLMPRARLRGYHLLLMAATAILILTAQHFFQAGIAARSAGCAAPSGSLPHESHARSRQPARGPRANWKTTLWRIYERSNETVCCHRRASCSSTLAVFRP